MNLEIKLCEIDPNRRNLYGCMAVWLYGPSCEDRRLDLVVPVTSNPVSRADCHKGWHLLADELRVAAMRQLNVSKSSFDFAWIDAIEKTGRHDWYEPLRGRRHTTT